MNESGMVEVLFSGIVKCALILREYGTAFSEIADFIPSIM